MNTGKNILLLNGSPKAGGGTSGALAGYLKDRLDGIGCNAEILSARSSISSQSRIEKLLEIAVSADAIALLFPLYIDSLPYTVTKALELIAEDEKLSVAGRSKQGLLAISNCGFPEAYQNGTALAICRQFAKETGRQWVGGLALGAGGAIDGQLNRAGRSTGKLKQSIGLAAAALAEGGVIPPEAVKLMAQPIISKWLYLWVAEYNWKRAAKKNGVWKKINDRPYKTTGKTHLK